MSYCSVQDLESYFLNKSFQCGDYLSNGKALDFIKADAALIDASLKVRYSLPITNTDDLLILKMLNERMVVGTIDDIFREKTDDGRFDRGRDTRKEALAILKQIKEGDLVLDASGKDSVMKFNVLDTNGNIVLKRFKDSNIEPNNGFTVDRERRVIIQED